jgi:neurotransmitter:Na+ symporter, NSS family
MEISDQDRGQWGSKFGFIMAAAGSAVGLGNIWRFPYITGQNGGGAFVLVYVVCVILIGIPMILTELGLGRMAGQSTVGAFKNTGANKFWMLAPFLALSVSFFVLTFYAVIGGWAIGYIAVTLFDMNITFEAFQQNPTIVLPLFGVFMVLTIGIVLGGISGGIEKASKILMPVLFVLLVLVAIRSITLPGAMAGLEFYLIPDFSKIHGTTVLMALSQAFFSMSVGWGIMVTYGSYLPKGSNLIESGLWVGFMDAMVALLAGFMIFPAVFAFGKDPAEGSTLVFKVLPEIFDAMPAGGHIVGALFFLLLTVAALTSSISILEVPASYFMDEKKWSRKKSAWVVGIMAFIIGIPSALTAIDGNFFSTVSIPWFGGATVTGWFGIIDTIFGTFFIVIVALMTSIYAGWIINYKKLIDNLGEGNSVFLKPVIGGLSAGQLFGFMLRYIIPITILLVLLNMLGVLGFFAGA